MQKKSWLWMIVLILCLNILAGFWLDKDGLWYDEVYTVKDAGGAQYGPLSPVEIYQQIDPYQSLGYPLLIAAWGAVVGWSEFALRSFSLLTMLLALAMTYRLAREAVSPSAGIFAALVFAFSSFTIFYSHELRAYSMMAFLSALLLWAYLRLLKTPTNFSRFCFVLAGAGLLYMHYYSAMLLIGVGIYHLLFVPKNRLWLEISGLAFLWGVAFFPALPLLLKGLEAYSPSNVEGAQLKFWEVLLSIYYYLSNDSLFLVSFGLLFGIGYLFRPETFTLRKLKDETKSYLALLLILLFSLIILLISNEILHIIEAARLRYAIFLWPLLALWVGAGWAAMLGVAQKSQSVKWLFAIGIPLLWVATALMVYFDPSFNESIEGTETPRFRTITNVMREEGVPSDLFAFYNGKSNQAWYVVFTFDYSVYDLPMPSLLTASLYNRDENISTWAWQQVEGVQRIWYGQNRTFEQNEVHSDFVAYLSENFVQCTVAVDETELGLELYARSQAFCPTERILNFDGFSLTGYELLEGDTLRLNLGWEIVGMPSDTYSLGVHVTGEGSDVPVLQSDTGFANARFQPMALSYDMSQLPAGEYQIWLIVYDWRSGTRLMGMGGDGETGDRLLLGTISR